jgi:hypothetical protein
MRRSCEEEMRQAVLAVPLAAALAVATAPIALADVPIPLEFGFPEGTSVCAGDSADVGSFIARIQRTSTGLQLSDGATVSILPLPHPPASDIAILEINGPDGLGEIRIPTDWTSQPEGSLSEGLGYTASITGVEPGIYPSEVIPWEVEELGPSPQSQVFELVTDPFEVVDCTPPPAPTPTVPPTDTATTPTRGADESAIALMLFALAVTALLLESVRHRPA